MGGGAQIRGAFRGISEAIGSGHAFVKHVLDKGEFRGLGIRNQKQFSDFVGNIMMNARGADMKQLNR